MKRFQRAHLVLGNALGPLEVIDMNFDVISAFAAEHTGRDGALLFDLPGIYSGKQGIHFGLIKYICHSGLLAISALSDLRRELLQPLNG
jgi:hypothetical protein